ncbi:MAG TPA: hypothetical protein VIL85_16180 [Thermomicrobiales bacterium]|jgi:hypothetical protein
MSLQQRLAKLEQTQTGDGGASVMGVRRIHWQTGEGPDVVTIPQTGERMTEGEFCERYPRGLLVLAKCYSEARLTDGEVA